MKVLIVEDEDLAALELKRILEGFGEGISVVAILQTIQELKSWLEQGGQADLMFCDIELRDGNILPFLKTANFNAAVVFTTAYDQFWQTALQSNGIDYLLKPIDQEKLYAVWQKVTSLKKIFNAGNEELLSGLTRYLNQSLSPHFKKRFPVRLNNEVFILDIEEVMYFKIVNGLILAHTAGQKKLPIAEQTLNELEALLDPHLFFRINRSEVVHIRYVESIQLQAPDDYIIRLKNTGEKLSVSGSRIAQLKNWINL